MTCRQVQPLAWAVGEAGCICCRRPKVSQVRRPVSFCGEPASPTRLVVVLRRAILGCVFLGSALAVACSSDNPTDPNEPSGGAGTSGGGGGPGQAIPGCVLQVIQDKCQRCHGEPLQHGAPVAFLTVSDFQARYFDSDSKWWQVAAQQVESDAMPFVVLNTLPEPIMPPVEPLTADEKATLLAWLKAGAMANDDTSCP